MYEIKKSKNLVEDLKISDGDKELVVHVDINLDKIARKFSVLQAEFAITKKEVDENPNNLNAVAKLGDLTISILNMLFGEVETARMMEFYEEKYIDLITDVFPFITSVIIPKLREASERKADNMRSAYAAKRKGFLRK